MNWCNGSSSLCRGGSIHPGWSNGSHHTCETRCLWLWMCFSICENKCCGSTNSVAWTFDSGKTIRVENVFPLVVFACSQLISLCPSVTDTLVTSRVTDIPRVFWETHDIVQAHAAACLEPAVLRARLWAAQNTQPVAVCYIAPEGRTKTLLNIILPKAKTKQKLKLY